MAFSGETNEDTLSLVASCANSNVQIDIVPRLFEAVGLSAEHPRDRGAAAARAAIRAHHVARRGWVKRAIDRGRVARAAARRRSAVRVHRVRVRRGSPGPVLFRQSRFGMNSRPFDMLKFRTMHADTDAAAHREYIEMTMDAVVTE